MNMALTGVALVARPCAPAAQRAEDSSSSRSRLAKSYGRFAPLDLKQDCFFRVHLPKIKCLVQSAFGGQRDFRPSINSPKAPFRQLKSLRCRLLRKRHRLNLKSSLHSELILPDVAAVAATR